MGEIRQYIYISTKKKKEVRIYGGSKIINGEENKKKKVIKSPHKYI